MRHRPGAVGMADDRRAPVLIERARHGIQHGSSAGLSWVLSVSNETLLGILTLRLPSGISTTSIPSEDAPDFCTSSFTTFQL